MWTQYVRIYLKFSFNFLDSEKLWTHTLLLLFSETWRWEWQLVAQTGKWVMKTLLPCCCSNLLLVWTWTNRKLKSAAGTFCATWFTCTDVFLQNEAPLFSQDGHKFFFTRAIPQGGRGKFFHISMSTSLVSKCSIMLFMVKVWYSVFSV